MARIAGVDLPEHKRVEIALSYIHGIGPTLARKIVAQVGVENNPKMKDLNEDEINKIREIVEKGHVVEGDLRREVSQNIRRLIEIGSYRGLRHRRGLPSRGQRTRTNARTKKGVRKTVAGRRRASAKK